jgi:hypothetical protein
MAGALSPVFKIAHFNITAMKPSNRLIIFLLLFFPITASAQDTFKPGFVITVSNEKITGSFKLLNGKLIAETPGKNKIYRPWDVKSFSIGSSNYISYTNDFYKEIVSGEKAGLFQKLTDNRNEKMYNGAEMIGFIKTTEGRKGDFYVLQARETELKWVTRKNFDNYFIRLFNGNDSLISKIKNGNLGYEQIEEVITLFNAN